jgi:hypothetical protein
MFKKITFYNYLSLDKNLGKNIHICLFQTGKLHHLQIGKNYCCHLVQGLGILKDEIINFEPFVILKRFPFSACLLVAKFSTLIFAECPGFFSLAQKISYLLQHN